MQLIVELNDLNALKDYQKLNNLAYILIGIKDLSLTPATTFDFNEIDAIIEELKGFKKDVGIIVNAERIFTDQELVEAKNLIEKLKTKKIVYFTYSDFGFYRMMKNNFKYDLIYRAPTYLTNYYDINLQVENNSYVVASSEIAREELVEIDRHVNNNYIVDLFGRHACFYSKRKLLSMYFNYRNDNHNPYNSDYYIIEELRKEKQPIKEDETGTHIFSTSNQYLLEEITTLKNAEYGIIHTIFLNKKQTKAVVKSYDNYLKTFDNEAFYKKLDENNVPYYKGQYDKKSILLKKEAEK